MTKTRNATVSANQLTMSSGSLAPFTRTQSQTYLTLLFAMLTVLFALQQTGLALLDYLPDAVTRILQSALVGATIAMASLGIANFARLPKSQSRILVMFIALNLFYGVASALFGGVRLLFHFESVVVPLALAPMISDPRIWRAMLRGMFWGGMTLIVLNMVTLLHWAGILHLNPVFIPRLVDVGRDISSLDAYSFGIFGRTENFEVTGQFFGRLHGWALEPLHWGYFATMTLACGMLLYALSHSARERLLYLCAFAIIAVHWYFIHSASVFLTLTAWLVAVAMLGFVRLWRRLRKRETFISFVGVILGIGFAVPFALSFIPEIETLLYSEQVTGKGSNWSMKIGFLGLGSDLFTRFLPLYDPDLETSHNLVLEMYLHYGYFLIVPLLYFFYAYLRRTVNDTPMMLSAAALLVLVCHLMLVPNAMFYPGGVLLLGLVMITAEYRRRRLAND